MFLIYNPIIYNIIIVVFEISYTSHLITFFSDKWALLLCFSLITPDCTEYGTVKTKHHPHLNQPVDWLSYNGWKKSCTNWSMVYHGLVYPCLSYYFVWVSTILLVVRDFSTVHSRGLYQVSFLGKTMYVTSIMGWDRCACMCFFHGSRVFVFQIFIKHGESDDNPPDFCRYWTYSVGK